MIVRQQQKTNNNRQCYETIRLLPLLTNNWRIIKLLLLILSYFVVIVRIEYIQAAVVTESTDDATGDDKSQVVDKNESSILSPPQSEDQQSSSTTAAERTRHRREDEDGDDEEDSIFDPIQGDASEDCDNDNQKDCVLSWRPPDSTIEIEKKYVIDATCSYGGADPDDVNADESSCQNTEEEIIIDKHWGSDPSILRMREKLRQTGSGCAANFTNIDTTTTDNTTTSANTNTNRRPPIFLMPGLASTRLVAWKFKSCPHHPFLSDIKVQDYVWLNINLLMQIAAIDVACMSECLRLGLHQTDADDYNTGCKLRPDEGLDAISSLSPGGIGSELLVGGTNTVYAWLIQWLADNLGYDVSSIVGLPYDWRLSPDKLQQRDGFLTLTRRRIEAAVQTNKEPGIVVAHSMGNTIFRYFLEWLKVELKDEAYHRYIKKAIRRAKATKRQQQQQQQSSGIDDTVIGTTTTTTSWTTTIGTTAATITEEEIIKAESDGKKHEKLWELAQIEGETNWYEWIETHIWTYVGLSAPLLGAVNPLRAVISGENMGLPFTDQDARIMEVTFGSTHTVNPISTKNAFCDDWDDQSSWIDDDNNNNNNNNEDDPSTTSDRTKQHQDSKLACLDDILAEIEDSVQGRLKPLSNDPWEKHPALKSLLLDRFDWDTNLPMIRIIQEYCVEKEKSPCIHNTTIELGPKDTMNGNLFIKLNDIWNEQGQPMYIKREQLKESFWDTKVPNILNQTWERPLIKHVIMAYGIDVPTEISYEYIKTERNITKNIDNKSEYDGIPQLQAAYVETAGGKIKRENFEPPNFKLTDFWKKKKKRVLYQDNGKLRHSGDGSVPYFSLAWAHTWLLHAVRARRYSGKLDGPKNPLDEIEINHRPEGGNDWKDGPPPKRIKIVQDVENTKKKVIEESIDEDTGTTHPHGTKYKPEMVRYHNKGTSRTTGIEYSTTVIEAVAVEHKETTRNYDILAAVFTDVLKFMHDDLNII